MTASCWGSASAIPNPSPPTRRPTPPWSTTSTSSTPAASPPIDAFWPPWVLELCSLGADRTLGTHPYLVVPDHTREARRLLGPGPVIAPEHKVILETDPDIARQIGRPFVANPYLKLRNYTSNLLRHGYTDHDIADGGATA